MHKLLLATHNPGKLIEMRSLLADVPIQLVTLADCDLVLQVVESGQTYAQNASRKALEYARAANLPTLADDSGLEVDVLNGAPGLYSARYSGQPGATDAMRRAYLLDKLTQFPRPWYARFVCTVAIAFSSAEVQLTEGICLGEIIPQERGQNGFGYDPIFLIPELGLTMAELTVEQKNLISHRARAVKAAIPLLLTHL
jgi:XTP/dITP diphosphohydrolase